MIELARMIMVIVSGSLLAGAAVLTVRRMARGPSSLDRVIAADVLVAIVIASLALEAIVARHTTTLPVIMVLALLGFSSSVSIARFVADRADSTRWSSPESEVDVESALDSAAESSGGDS